MAKIVNPYKKVFRIEQAADLSLDMDEGFVKYKEDRLTNTATATLLACLGIPKGYFLSVEKSVAKKLLPEAFDRKVLEGSAIYMVMGFDNKPLGAIPGWKRDLSILEVVSEHPKLADSVMLEEGNPDYRVFSVMDLRVKDEVFSLSWFLDAQVVGHRQVTSGWRIAHEASGLGFILDRFTLQDTTEEKSMLFDFVEDTSESSWMEERLAEFAEEKFDPRYYINHPWFARLPKSIRTHSREGLINPTLLPKLPPYLHGTSLGMFMTMGMEVSKMSIRSRIKAEQTFGERLGQNMSERDI